MKAGGVINSDAPRHPFPEMSPETRAGLLDAAKRLDPLVLRWGKLMRAAVRRPFSLPRCCLGRIACRMRSRATGRHPARTIPTLLIQGDRWCPASVHDRCKGLQRLESSRRRARPGAAWRPCSAKPTSRIWWACMPCPSHKGVDVWAPKVFQHAGKHLAAVLDLDLRQERARPSAWPAATSPDGWRLEETTASSWPATASDNFNAIDADLFDREGWSSCG